VQPRLLASDPQLHQHRVRGVQRGRALGGCGQPAGPARGLQDPGRERPDHREPIAVRVEEHELVDGQRVLPGGQPADQLRRVGGAPTDDHDLQARHPFTPVSVTPWTNAFCARKKSRITGSMNSTVAAIVRFHCT
jgi:hypothetical protein